MATIHRLMDSSDEEDEIGEMINPMTGKIKSRKTYIQRGPENYHHSGGACGTDTVMPEYFNKITTKIPKRMPENRMFKKTELKNKIITDSNNNMIITNENLFGDMVLPMNMVYKENGKKKPSYPHKNKGVCFKLFGPGVKPSSLCDNPLTQSLYNKAEFDNINEWNNALPEKAKRKMNAYSIYLDKHKIGVIDADSKESSDMIRKAFPSLPYTRSFGNINNKPGKKGCHHFFFTKDLSDVDRFVSHMAKQNGFESGITDPKFNFDILVTTTLFENKGETVKNWDGSNPPTITMKEISKYTISGIQFKNKTTESLSQKNKKLTNQREKDNSEESTIYRQENFNTIVSVETVKALLDITPTKDLLSQKNWSICLNVVKSQITNVNGSDVYLCIFQEKMKNVFDKHKDENNKIDGLTWTKWKNENETLWGKILKKNYHIGWLWRKAYETDRIKWAEIKNKSSGIPCPRIMQDIKLYDLQKAYFENYAYLVMNGKESTVYIKDMREGKWFGNGLTKSEAKNQEWSCVSSYETKKQKNKAGELEEVEVKIGDFINCWLHDPHKRRYTYQDFLPEGIELLNDRDIVERIDSNEVCNNYNKMRVRVLGEDPKFLQSVEDMKIKNEEEYGDKYHSIEKMLELIYFLSGKEKVVYDYVMVFISMLLVYPAIRPGVFLLFKSIPGVGKNLLWDWIGDKLLGREYYMCSAHKSAWFDKHSVDRENKLLLFLNEMSPSDTIKHLSTLKEMITDEWGYLNPKGEKMRTFRNLASYVGGTNLEFAVPVENSDRRMCLIECDSGHKSVEGYFSDIINVQDNTINQYLFFEYCRDVIKPEPEYNFERNKPKTAYHGATAERCMPKLEKFFKWFTGEYHRGEHTEINNMTSKNGFTDMSGLWNIYDKDFIMGCKEGKDTYHKGTSGFEMDIKKYVIDNTQGLKKDHENKLSDPVNNSKFIIKKRVSRNKKNKTIFIFNFDRYYNHRALYMARDCGKDYTEERHEIENYKREEELEFI